MLWHMRYVKFWSFSRALGLNLWQHRIVLYDKSGLFHDTKQIAIIIDVDQKETKPFKTENNS